MTQEVLDQIDQLQSVVSQFQNDTPLNQISSALNAMAAIGDAVSHAAYSDALRYDEANQSIAATAFSAAVDHYENNVIALKDGNVAVSLGFDALNVAAEHDLSKNTWALSYNVSSEAIVGAGGSTLKSDYNLTTGDTSQTIQWELDGLGSLSLGTLAALGGGSLANIRDASDIAIIVHSNLPEAANLQNSEVFDANGGLTAVAANLVTAIEIRLNVTTNRSSVSLSGATAEVTALIESDKVSFSLGADARIGGRGLAVEGTIVLQDSDSALRDIFQDVYLAPSLTSAEVDAILASDPLYDAIKTRTYEMARQNDGLSVDIVNDAIAIEHFQAAENLIPVADFSLDIPNTDVSTYLNGMDFRSVAQFVELQSPLADAFVNIAGESTYVASLDVPGSTGVKNYAVLRVQTTGSAPASLDGYPVPSGSVATAYTLSFVRSDGEVMDDLETKFTVVKDPLGDAIGLLLGLPGEAQPDTAFLQGQQLDIKEALRLVTEAGAAGGSCFAEGTPILLADGSEKPIEQIVIGDSVMAFDTFGELKPRRVTQTYINQKPTLLRLSNGLLVTPDHPFVCPDGVFKPIKDILAESGEIVDKDGNVVSVYGQVVQSANGELAAAVGSFSDVQKVGTHTVFNFTVEGLHTYIAGGIRVHNDSVLSFIGANERVLDADIPNGYVKTYSTVSGQVFVTRTNTGPDGNSQFVTREEFFKDDRYKLSETYDTADIVTGANGKPVFDETTGRILLQPGADGDLYIEDFNGQIINYQQLGGVFGSALGNAIGDNVIEDVVFSAAFDTLFTSFGKSIDIFNGKDDGSLFKHQDHTDGTPGANVDSLEESIDISFSDFGSRLGANLISAGIGQISSFVVGELIGGDSLAADLGRTVANSFVSSALTDFVATEVLAEGSQVAGFLLKGNGGPFTLKGFNPINAIGSFLGSQLASRIVQAEGEAAALVSSIFGTIGSIIGSAIPVVGTFIGQFVGEVFGALVGNALFGDEDYPRAIGQIGFDANGRAVDNNNYTGVDGMAGTAVQPAVQSMVTGLNAMLDRFGPDARFSSPDGYLFNVGYISVDGYQGLNKGYTVGNGELVGFVGWNQTGFDHTSFNEAYKFAALWAAENGRLSGGDAWGRRVLYYGGWETFEQLMDQLQIAVDYRKYLADKDVIDRLISEAPDSAFAIGWLITISQAASLGFTNPDALQNLIEGTDVTETLAGTVYNDEIIGKAGNDILQGGEGNDLLNGGLGADHLDGGVGLDTASYRTSAGGVLVDLALGTSNYADAIGDTFSSIERLFGSDHGDTLLGDAGDNLLAGYGGNDTLHGRDGDDTIEGGAGADALEGGAGYDIATYAGSSVGVRVTLQEGTTLGFGLDGDAQGDTLHGFEAISGSLFSDILTGNSADNMLLGSDGNDFLEGLGGADRLLGGSGADFAVYTSSDAGVYVNLATGEASGGHAEGDVFDSIEYVIGSAHDDIIIGDGFGNVIEGGLGADVLDGGAGMDAISYANSSAGIHIDLVNQTVRSLDVTASVRSDAHGDTIANFEHVIGTNFDDEIIVGHDNAVILAGAGDDVITPFSGNVSIDGGAGYDTADFSRIDAGGDFQPLYAAGLFTGSQWQDVQIFQGSDIYAVWDQALQGAAVDANSFGANTNQYDIKLHSIEMLRATEFDDRIAFNDIGQHVDAAGGNDQMIGQSGNDVFYGGTGDDALDGAGGNDTLRGDEGNDVLHGGGGADALYGGDGDDVLQGDGHFNANPYGIFTVVDTGPQGADYLDGGAGDDILRGGGANDVYRFGRGYGSDTIIDSAYVAGPPTSGKIWSVPTSVLVNAGHDTIAFADDVLPTDIEATSIGSSLVLKIKGTSDQITITGMGHSFTAIESLQFDALGLTVDLTGLGAAGAAAVISSIGTDAELFSDGGTFTPHTVANVTEIAGLTDFNNDGTLDVAGVNGYNAFVAFGSGDAFSYAQVDSKGIPIPSSGIFHAVGAAVGVESEAADIDGDGTAEIVSWRSTETNQPYVRFAISGDYIAPNVAATQAGTSLPWIDIASGDAFRGGDVNGNGRDQFVRARWTQTTNIRVETVSFAHNGAATVGTQDINVVSTGLTSAIPFTWQIADINADGRDDLIVIAASATYVALAQPTVFGALTQTSAGITYDPSTATKYATGDINGDGYEDLIKVNQSTISVAFGNASGTLTTDPAFNVSTPASVQSLFTTGASFEVHLADKNGDGRDDLYFAGTTGVAVFTNNFAQIVGSIGNDVFVGTNGADVFAGLAGNDSLSGGAGRDGLRGDEGADTLDGGADNDYLEGGAGNDTLIGGTGHDRAVYHSGAQYYTIAQSGGSWTITDINGADGNDGTDTLTGVEEAYFDGRLVKLDGSNNDPFASGPVQGHVIDPGTAFSYTLPAGLFHDVDTADTLTVSLVMADGRALPSWLTFSAATGVLSGTPGAGDADVLDLLAVASDGSAQASVPFRIAVRGSVSGTDEDDTLDGLGIYERMSAGDGNDTLKGSAGADIIDGGAGVDTIDYSGSFFAISASLAGAVGTAGDAWGDQLSNIENIIGTKHADVIYGSSANNYIDAGLGDDWVDAGAGNDYIKVGSRSAHVIGGAGWDVVDYGRMPAGANGAGMYVNFSALPGSILNPGLESVEEIIGTNWTDYFTGDENVNVFRGGLGNDIFAGWGGNDTLEGGAGADNLDGGDGSDTVSYATSDAGVTVNLTAGSASGGHADGDLLVSFENVTGSAHGDLLYGDAGGNQLRGGAGNDQLTGLAGGDYLDGGAGSDFARYDASTAGVNVNLTADTATGGYATGDVLDNIEHLVGSAHADFLAGDANSNTLYGQGGNDTLYGMAGDDVLLGGAGADALHGGDGIDRAQYSSSTAGVTINLFLTTAQSGGYAQGDILSSIETVYGSNHADTIAGDHSANTLWGYGGNDQIFGNGGNDVIYGQDGNDMLIGQGGADYIDGGAGTDLASFHGSTVGVSINLATGEATGGTATGDTLVSIEDLQGSNHNDVLTGDAGANRLLGLAGNDTLIGGEHADVLDGGNGWDTIDYSTSSARVVVDLNAGSGSGGDAEGDTYVSIERVIGTAYNDVFTGDNGSNEFVGGDGHDDFRGLLGGVDTLIGGAGIDTAYYNYSTSGVTIDLVAGTGSGGNAQGDVLSGIERVVGTDHNDVLTGDAADNSFWGLGGNDTLNGGGGNDLLYGGAGADTLDGGDGNDVLYAGADGDTLDGGGGTDTANYTNGTRRVFVDLAIGLATNAYFQSTYNAYGAYSVDTGWSNQETYPRMLGDVNGDGIDDVVGFASDGVYVSQGSASGYFSSAYLAYGAYGAGQGWTNQNTYPRHVADVNGDGIDDVVGFASDGVYVSQGNANGYFSSAYLAYGAYGAGQSWTTQDTYPRMLGDVNGDGIDDVVGFASDGVYVSQGNANGYFSSAYLAYGAYGAGQSWTTQDTYPRMLGDVNGDGIDDVVGFASDGVYVSQGNASGVFSSAYLAYGGYGASAGWPSQDTYPRMLGDVNGDGIDDIVAFASDGVYVSHGSVSGVFAAALKADTGFSNSSGWSSQNTYPRMLGDVNGDGLDDIAGFATGGVYVGLGVDSAVSAGTAKDTLANIENVSGTSYADTLLGDAGVNVLSGQAGDDVLGGQGGADILNGGDGFDTATYVASTAAVNVNLATGIAAGGDAEGDALISVENLHGSAYGDTLTGDAGVNALWGYSGNDTLEGGAGSDTLYGGAGDDVLKGGSAGDHLLGEGGNDTLIGGEHADVLDGGNGWDTIDYSTSSARVVVDLNAGSGSGGDAEGDTYVSIERVIGTAYNDVFTGDNGSNEFVGGDGHDDFRGLLGGVDTLIGGAGIDTAYYNYSTSGVTIDLVAGTGSGGNAQGDVLSGIERVVGTDHNDVLTGDAADNSFWGLGGNDTLNGGGGNDLLYGGAGADTLDGGDGFDWALYEASDAGVTINLAVGTATGGYATGDTLTSIENVLGSSHNDVLTGDAGVNVFYGGDGFDAIYTQGGDDTLVGGVGDDVLEGGAGADTLDGGEGVDWAQYYSSAAGVSVNLATGAVSGGDAAGDTFTSIENLFGSAHDDVLTGDGGANVLDGYLGNDTLNGAGGNDTLYGQAGNDVLEGGAGADTLDGGAGNDTASYVSSSAGVTVDLFWTTAQTGAGDAVGDILTSIENVVGSSHGDVLYAATGGSILTGGDGDDNLVARAGVDTLDGGGGLDWANYSLSTAGLNVDLSLTTAQSGGFAEGDILIGIEKVYGSNVDDTIRGHATDDYLVGYGGNDVLEGRAGADTLDGGDGVDTASYAGSAAGVTIDIRQANGAGVGGDAEGDVLVGIENVTGSSFGDTLWGNDQANVLVGGAGNDSFVGGAGNDTIQGGAGNDTLRGQAGADVLDGGDGVDTVRYDWDTGPVTVNLATGTASGGDAEGDTLIGIENLVGSALNDVLTGDAGNNSLSGLDGDDLLSGGAGSNTLDGGFGSDTAVFSGNFADYALSISGNGGTVSGLGETSSLANIETLSFADRAVTLDALNNAPILVSAISNQTVFRDVPLSLDVSGNFVDIDAGDTLSFAATLADGSALPAWVSIDAATGILSGTATTSDLGLLAVKVIATDGSGAAAEAVFDLDVTRTNVAPTAGTLVDQVGSEGTALAFTIPGATFADADAGEVLTLSATLSDGSALPTWLTFDPATGAFSGTPSNTSAGVLSLSVTATDSFGETAAAGFDLTIANVNDAPTAANTTGSVDEGQVYVLDLATLTSDLDGDALTYSLPSVPGTGTASLAGSVLTYTSVVGGFGPASIGYQVNDGNGGVANGTVDLTVNDINFAPTAGNSGATVNEGQGFTLDLATLTADLDGDALTFSINSGPAVGSASISGSTLTFNSTIGTSGNHNIGYTVSDGQGGTANGIVTATINDINFAPTANNSSGTVNEGQSFSINLATLVSDIDGDTLSYSIHTNPAAGSASISGSTLTYTSVHGQPGNYNIGYTVSDGQGGGANANITANILDVNYAPTAVNNHTAYSNYFFSGIFSVSDLLANDTDPDGDVLTVTGFSNLVNINSIAQSPSNPDYYTFNSNVGLVSHSGSFVYTVSDGHGHTSSATYSYDFTYAPLPPPSKPIVFDLGGNGIELVNADESDIFFDLNGDGEAEDTGWVDSDDALLTYDKNDDGLITDHDEVSFVGYKEGARTDLEGLRAFDTNGDGVLDAADAEFGSFNIWQDINQNGVSDSGELRSLTAAGIASIALVSDETVRVAGDNVSFGIGQFTRTDGTTGNFSDTGFGTGQGLADAASSLDHVADESGLIAGADVIRLNASLEEVLDGHFQSSLVVQSDTAAVPYPSGDQNIAGLVSAMAAFDPKAGGEAQANATDDDHQAPAIAAWVA